MNKKQQVIVIHGGSTFDNSDAYLNHLNSFVVNLERIRYQKNWKDSLQEELGCAFDVFQPRMPNNSNAQYTEWKIMFEKVIDKVDNDFIIIGHSLGALFLTKYLSENSPSKRVKSVFLVAAPFDDQSKESFGSFTIDIKKVENITLKTDNIFLYFSKDDPVVAFSEADKYRKALPRATMRILDKRGHFRQEKFPELIVDLQTQS